MRGLRRGVGKAGRISTLPDLLTILQNTYPFKAASKMYRKNSVLLLLRFWLILAVPRLGEVKIPTENAFLTAKEEVEKTCAIQVAPSR